MDITMKIDCDNTIKSYHNLHDNAPTPTEEFVVEASMLDTLRNMVSDGHTEEAIYILEQLGRPEKPEIELIGDFFKFLADMLGDAF